MSQQQKRNELLIFGFVRYNYAGMISSLIKLIQLFYDEMFYWIVQDQELTRFLSTTNGQKLRCQRTFKIKEMEFILEVYPNGATKQWNGLVTIGVRIIHLPENIEYIEFNQNIECDSTPFSTKLLRKATQYNYYGAFGSCICQLSQLKKINPKNVCFNCKINIIHIKYTKKSKKIDFISPIIMHKQNTFTWNVNGSLMQTCKETICRQKIYSHNFDNDNWCLILYPNGGRETTNGKLEMCLNCLSLPFNIHTIEIEWTFIVDGIETDVKTYTDIISNEKKKGSWFTTTPLESIMSFSDFKNKESISFTVNMNIKTIYDFYGYIEDKNEWNKYGII
eukprot:309279_1